MNFPFFSKGKHKEELYLGLFLKEDDGVAIVMSKTDQGIQIKDKESFVYTNGWENLTDNIDEVLYRLEKKLDTQLSKTIFFVYSHLVDDKNNDIKKPYLDRIKEMVKNLELEALGYIECFEAVSFYLEKIEEAPLTAVLMELDKKQMSLFVYKGGKLNYKSVSARTDNIIDDFIQATSGIKGKAMLPSRIILYDSGNIDDAASKIISHRFGEGYFVQIPKITILKNDEVMEGLRLIFSSQIVTRQPIQVEEKKTMPKESFGFVIGEDIGEKTINEKKQQPEKIVGNGFKPFPTLKLNLPKFNLPKINWAFFRGKTAIYIGAAVIVLALFLNEYFFHKAKVTVYLPSQKIDKSLAESLDYKVASVSADFSESTSTTGRKEVGDRAKGNITIHNFDDQDKTFSKGTTLTASNLAFTLDSDVKVASSTLAPDGSAKLPGKNTGSITANDIGDQSNLSKNTHFKIGDLSTSTYFAINDQGALTGGSKKEIRTVSSDDQKNLQKTILNKAKNQVKSPSFPEENVIIPELSSTSLIDTNYSKEIGEETDSVTLSAKAQSTYFAYDKNTLLSQLMGELRTDVNSGYSLKPDNINFQIKQAKINGQSLDLKLDVKARAIKEFEENGVLDKITGKNQSSLESILKSGYQVQGYDVTINEPLPFLNKFLPFFKNNISLKISSL